METIGSYLKRQREIRKISLEEIASVTKINLKCLKALENDDLEALPGDVFAKGFVKAYARAVGLSPDETLLQFEEYLKTTAASNLKKKDRIRWISPATLQFKPWVIFVFLMAVVLVAAYLSSR